MTNLSERLRPGSEAAPWVVEAVQALEAENEALRGAIQDAKWELSKLKSWNGKNHVWQSYYGRLAYETLDEALK